MKKSLILNDFRYFVRKLPCCISNSECFGDIIPHHVEHKNKGVGDKLNLVPLCFNHHTGAWGVHNLGKKSFQKKYNLCFDNLKTRIWYAYLRQQKV